MKETLLLGVEYDDCLRDALGHVLRELGGKLTNKSWGLGGSQVIETWEIEIDGALLLIEAETYMGLSLIGDPALVHRVGDLVRKRLGAD
jgi:hypothetical protein